MTLEACDLAMGHGGTEIGREISLTLAPGGILCLLGPNGYGKTTLFRTLLGLIPTLRGRVTLRGQPLHRLDRTAIARQVAYVPQAHAPPFPHAAREIVLMGRTARLGAFAQPGAADREAALTAKRLTAVYGVPVLVERTTGRRRVCIPALAPHSVASITSEALITTQAVPPSAMPRSLTASVVIMEVMTLPPPMSTVTWLFTGPVLSSVTVPLIWLRALIFIGRPILAGTPAARAGPRIGRVRGWLSRRPVRVNAWPRGPAGADAPGPAGAWHARRPASAGGIRLPGRALSGTSRRGGVRAGSSISAAGHCPSAYRS